MPVRINGSTSGYVELAAPAVAGSTSLTLPATTGNVPVLASGASSGESSSLNISTKPWNMPWGVVAYKTETSNLNFTSTETESAKTTSFTAVANRLYEVTYYEVSVHVAASQYAQLRLRVTNTSGTQLQNGYINNKAAVDYGQSFSLTWVGTLSAGSTVIISSIQSQTTTKTAYRGNDQPAVLIVKDIGPA